MDGNSKVTIDRIFEIYDDLLSNDSTVKLRNFLKSIGKLETIIQNMHEAINEDEKEMKEKNRIENEKEIEKQRKCAIQYIRDSIAKYNQIVLKLVQCQNRENINSNVCNLFCLKDNLSHYPELFKTNDGINLKTIKYCSKKDIIITLSKNGNIYKMKLPNTGFLAKTTYLFPNEELQDKDLVNKTTYLQILDIHDTFFNYIYEQYCDTNYDLSHLINNNNAFFVTKIPEMTFGSNYLDTTIFMNKLNTLNHDLKSLDKIFFQKIESKQVIEYDDFNLIKEIEDIIKIIKPNLCASFTDHSECPKTRFILQNDLKDFLDILLPLFSNFSHLTQKELYPAQKVLKVIIKQEERKKEEECKEKLQTPKNEFEKQMNEFENQMKLMFEQMKLCLKNEMEDKNKEFQKKLDEKEEEIQRLTEQLKILQKQTPTTTNENIEKK